MTDLDTLTRLWMTEKITTEDLYPDERVRVHQRVLELEIEMERRRQQLTERLGRRELAIKRA